MIIYLLTFFYVQTYYKVKNPNDKILFNNVHNYNRLTYYNAFKSGHISFIKVLSWWLETNALTMTIN